MLSKPWPIALPNPMYFVAAYWSIGRVVGILA
jgi:hypothetical protein